MSDPQLDQFYAADGTKIVYRCWQPEHFNQRILVLLHRGHEHSGRMSEMAHYFCDRGYLVYAWDARGNGLSEGERDYAPSCCVVEQDLDQFIRLILATTELDYPDLAIITSSMGAITAAAWVHDYAPKIRGMILATPSLAIRLYMPFAEPLLMLAQKFNWMPRVSSYVKSKMLTHDRSQQRLYNEDPLISGSIATPFLLDTLKTGRRLLADAQMITVPTLILSAGKDWVVRRAPQRKFYQRLASSFKEWHYNKQAHHALFIEDDRQQTFARCLKFLDTIFTRPPETVDFTDADTHSLSRDQYDALQLPSFNPTYPIVRWAIKYLGGISQGITIGRNQGFDSGASLEYVYNNQPSGKTWIGRLIDQQYLNAPGWQGIRARKKLLEQQLHDCIAALRRDNRENNPVRILDIAAGNGQYLFDLAKNDANLQLELRDLLAQNIETMQAMSQSLGLEQQFSFTQADAFDANSYQPQLVHDIAISSGIYELFTANAPLKVAIQGIYQQLAEHGYYIYTNQPWHSQQEFIARTLPNHQGQLWQMRCRPQTEMDELVESAGFCKVAMLIDPSGMFTVSISRRVSSSV